jgi:hypothetical protein
MRVTPDPLDAWIFPGGGTGRLEPDDHHRRFPYATRKWPNPERHLRRMGRRSELHLRRMGRRSELHLRRMGRRSELHLRRMGDRAVPHLRRKRAHPGCERNHGLTVTGDSMTLRDSALRRVWRATRVALRWWTPRRHEFPHQAF